MSSPADCRYSESHEWFRIDGDVVTLGLTRFAADELTDLTFVELKPPGTRVEAGGAVGEVESVKTTSDVYSAVAGEVVEINRSAINDPSLVNTDPFGDGWLVKLRVSDPSPLESLMSHTTYDEKHAGG